MVVRIVTALSAPSDHNDADLLDGAAMIEEIARFLGSDGT
jgi:hypothetical protein